MQDNDIHHRDHDPHPIVSHESTNGLKQNDEHVHITEQQTGVYLTLYLASRGTEKKAAKKIITNLIIYTRLQTYLSCCSNFILFLN